MGGKKREAEAEVKAAEAEHLSTAAEAAGAVGAYRPHTQEALNNSLQQQLSVFSGTNSLLEQMGLSGFGGGEQYGNVVSKDMMGVGQGSKSPGFAEEKEKGGKSEDKGGWHGRQGPGRKPPTGRGR